MKKLLLVAAFAAAYTSAFCQDVSYARHIVDTLTSSTFWGRGYTNDGMQKAAAFIATEFKSFGLKPLAGPGYFQDFTYPVNVFPGKMEVSVNGQQLRPGLDFIVEPGSRSAKGAGKLIQQDSTHFINPRERIIITVKDKLTWSVAPMQQDYTAIEVLKNSLKSSPESVKVNIDAKLNQSYKAANVAALVPGKKHPDSMIVLTAHYDHLGGMGKETFFPGANDNASGMSLLLSLAKYYAANPQPYTIAFICFAGEEAGLIGSKYFTEHPLIPLQSIRFLTNVDLVGTGNDGVTVVNSTEFPKEFAWLNEINNNHKYLVKINARGKAANSDHYWFTEKGVPAFFIYTMGGIAAYHDVYDKGETLPLTEFRDLFNLLVKFNEGLMK